MPGKSKQKRSKQSVNSRKARTRQRTAATAQTPAAPRPVQSRRQQEVYSSPETISRQSPRTQVLSYPHVVNELRTIGILAAAILVILIILYFTLG